MSACRMNGCGEPTKAKIFAKDVPRLCYTAAMFIHRISITGCSDRGAWPWRDSHALPSLLLPRAD